jgi:hypothetical protein
LDDCVDPSTSQSGTPSSTWLANIPKEVVEDASKCLRKLVSPTDDDVKIVQFLSCVWALVQDTIEKDPELKIRLASKEEFYANIARKGEKNLIDSLRAMATNNDMQGSKAWEDLFEDGTSFSFGPSILISFTV